MAELIPLEYRIQAARQELVHRWITVGVVAAMIAGAGLATTFAWRARKTSALAALQKQYQSKSVLIAQAKELEARRVNLAERSHKLSALQNDNVLLSLLGIVSRSFSDNDCLQFVEVEAHDLQPGAKPTEKEYSVRIRGITASDTTHSRLLENLTETGKKATPRIDVPLGEKQLKTMLDGEVTVFDITCKEPQTKGT